MTKEVPKRGKGKIKSGKTLDDAHVILKDHFGVDISRKEFRRIAYAINETIMNDMRDGIEMSMPYRLGSLRVKKNKVNLNNLKIDYNYYNKTGKLRKYLNEHSGGYYFRYHWDRTLCDIKHNRYYSFIPTRKNKKLLVAILKEGTKGKMDYFV